MKPLILFDIDDTLLKESPTLLKSFEYVCENVYGVKVDIYNFPRYGMTAKGIIYGLLKDKGITENQILNKIDKAFNKMTDYFMKNMAKYDYELIPGALNLLMKLASMNFKMGIVSGVIKPIALERLNKAKIAQYFITGAYGEEDTLRSNLVKLAIERANIKNNHVFVVGDTPLDIEAAIETNTIPIGVATGKYSVKELINARAKFVLKNYSVSEINKFTSFISNYIRY